MFYEFYVKSCEIMKSEFYVTSISVCASWVALRKPYIILSKYNALGGRDHPRAAFAVILAKITKISEHLVKVAKIHENS